MGNEWLSWGRGGGNRREEAAGCMSALLKLFHFHHFRLASPHQHDSNAYPFLQEEATTATGLEAPRNSLELAMEQEDNLNLNFPEGIRIKTRISRLEDVNSQSSCCDSPGTKTPSLVARLMGLDLLPECNSPSVSNPRKDTSLLRVSFSDDAAAVLSLPETPRTSSSSRKSDVERHRLSLQTTKEGMFKDEISLSDQKTVRRRGRFKKDDDGRSFGLDITNNQNLSLLNPNKKKNSKKEASPRSRISSSYDANHQTRERKKVNNGKCVKKLPPRARAAAADGSSKSRREKGGERNKLQFAGKKSEIHTKLPTKQSQSQVSEALSSKTNTRVSNKPSQSYSQLSNGGTAALHGGASRNYVEKILKHAGLVNYQVNPLAKWNTLIDPAIFHRQEFKAAATDCYDAVSSRRSERKLVFELVAELLGRGFTSPFKPNQRVSPVGCFPAVEELCKIIESFPAATCVVLEDIDLLIERDLCESQWNGYWVEEEVMVCEIEGEIVEWLVHEAVAVMGGAAAEERTEIGVCRVGLRHY